MPTLDLDDVTIAYDIAGDPDAPPVVLMAGCGGPAAGWFAIVPALTAAGCRVVTAGALFGRRPRRRHTATL
jgi:pimeloyl-ACP methyl ester carboxylesterase